MANSNERSSYQKFDRNALTEHYKRSDHNDFATSSELKKKKFSGWRHNSVAEVMELWVLGEVKRTITPQMYGLDPQIMEKTYAEVFAL